MANVSIHFPKTRSLLAILSVMSLILSAPIAYAQDVPTPTPPADGGDFDGAPDPTPGPEVTPESAPVDGSMPETESTDSINGDGIPAEDAATPAEDVPATDPSPLPNNNGELPEAETAVPTSTETPVTPETEATADESEPDEDSMEDEADTNAAPENNSPRGLW